MEPLRVITEVSEVVISHEVEVCRLKIALRIDSRGLNVGLTDASSRKLYEAVANAGEGAYYLFEGREAIILKPEYREPLPAWEERMRTTVERLQADGRN